MHGMSLSTFKAITLYITFFRNRILKIINCISTFIYIFNLFYNISTRVRDILQLNEGKHIRQIYEENLSKIPKGIMLIIFKNGRRKTYFHSESRGAS